MLGLSRGGEWRWGYYGKHPSVGDFVLSGDDRSGTGVLFRWIERGFQTFLRQRRGKTYRGDRTWRFWMGGGKRGWLICGTVKDSWDSHGRPFPFAVVGMGTLSMWEDHWELLPYALRKSWQRMEALSAERHLEGGKRWFVPPEAKWDDFGEEASRDLKGTPLESLGLNRQGAFALARRIRDDYLTQGVTRVSFRTTAGQAVIGAFVYRILRGLPLPTASFLGGGGMSSTVWIFGRPLRNEDFVKLWSPSEAEAGTGEGGEGLSLAQVVEEVS